MFPINYLPQIFLYNVHMHIEYLISAPSWISENVNVWTPAAETSEVVMYSMSSVVIVLWYNYVI